MRTEATVCPFSLSHCICSVPAWFPVPLLLFAPEMPVWQWIDLYIKMYYISLGGDGPLPGCVLSPTLYILTNLVWELSIEPINLHLAVSVRLHLRGLCLCKGFPLMTEVGDCLAAAEWLPSCRESKRYINDGRLSGSGKCVIIQQICSCVLICANQMKGKFFLLRKT